MFYFRNTPSLILLQGGVTISYEKPYQTREGARYIQTMTSVVRQTWIRPKSAKITDEVIVTGTLYVFIYTAYLLNLKTWYLTCNIYPELFIDDTKYSFVSWNLSSIFNFPKRKWNNHVKKTKNYFSFEQLKEGERFNFLNYPKLQRF